MRNPPWNRHELILALDLYFKLEYGQMHGKNIDVFELSSLLTLMNTKGGFERSVNSIPLKLANFKRFDPNYDGKGMKSGGKLDLEIWNEFVNDKNKLIKVASNLKNEIIESAVSNKKQQFIRWLSKVGKLDGTDYQERTILTYANQIESIIVDEFQLEIKEIGGLYGVTEIESLLAIEKKLKTSGDSKKRRDLRSAFQNYIRFIKDQFEFNDSVEINGEIETHTEGGKKVYISQKAERDVGIRNKAIAIHGTSCKACGFNYGLFYGEWGKDYIEVHHLIPLGGEASKERNTNPKTDLTVLCANCHRMVHRKRKKVLSLEELKNKILMQTDEQ
ncbi:HNH endonuclease [Aquimarina sp. 2201CG1-2-11]|uniref:HNH endonuclease n=1 Tax=Aquimarina discodermiae TaxID=3231043 RepID=UPI0034626956